MQLKMCLWGSRTLRIMLVTVPFLLVFAEGLRAQHLRLNIEPHVALGRLHTMTGVGAGIGAGLVQRHIAAHTELTYWVFQSGLAPRYTTTISTNGNGSWCENIESHRRVSDSLCSDPPRAAAAMADIALRVPAAKSELQIGVGYRISDANDPVLVLGYIPKRDSRGLFRVFAGTHAVGVTAAFALPLVP